MLMLRRRLLPYAAAALLAAGPAFGASGPVVNAPAGRLQGTAQGDLNVFKDIPYAVPPVGSLRWRAPQALPRWPGLKRATAYGPACYQPHAKFISVYSEAPMPMSENCLTLNIWAPKNVHNAPVFFWIYGGALWSGASRESLYDGAALARTGLVVVTINYRLGVLGWLADPELSAKSVGHISGNYGLLDQIAALKWVKRNIAVFGGDPSNVTIAGESAGGLSVMYLMASPEARGLFAKAIAQSAYMISTPPLRVPEYGEVPAETAGADLVRKLGAKTIASLRAMAPGKLTDEAAAARFAPFANVDGHVLLHQLVTTFDRGQEAPVPILAGFNSGEIRSLRILAPPVPASRADYVASIHARYGDLADAFLKLYPARDMKQSILATTRDALYGWTAERLVRKQTAQGKPSYLYYFDHGYRAEDAAGLHAFHASELPYMFGNLDRTGPHWPKIPATPEQQKLSTAMVDYWSSFARTGHPVANGEPRWLPFGIDGAYMAFTNAPHAGTHLLPGMYRLNEEVVCRRRAAGDISWNWNVGLVSPPLPPKAHC